MSLGINSPFSSTKWQSTSPTAPDILSRKSSFWVMMPERTMVAVSCIAPMPTSVKEESAAMRMMSLTEASARIAAAISWEEASSGAGMR